MAHLEQTSWESEAPLLDEVAETTHQEQRVSCIGAVLSKHLWLEFQQLLKSRLNADVRGSR